MRGTFRLKNVIPKTFQPAYFNQLICSGKMQSYKRILPPIGEKNTFNTINILQFDEYPPLFLITAGHIKTKNKTFNLF